MSTKRNSNSSADTRKSFLLRSSVSAIAVLAVACCGATALMAKGGTAKPPVGGGGGGVPPPPVGVAPAPQPLLRTIPATAVALPAPSPAQDLLNHQFSIIGFVQSYNAARACPGGGSGGDVKINGIDIVIPCNMIVQMPANTVTWAEFTTGFGLQALPAPPNSGYDLATNNTLPPGAARNPSMELRLEGNFVGTVGAAPGTGSYVAALGFASQQSVNSGTGVITRIDYSTGHLIVASNRGTTVELEINDPIIPSLGTGRFGRPPSPPRDDRLSVDQANPTITASTGYPMCIPRTRVDLGADDARCPQKNRPTNFAQPCRDIRTGLGLTLPNAAAGNFFNGGANGGPAPGGGTFCTTFVMKAPTGTPIIAGYPPASATATALEADAREQAPFEVGDNITWNGSLLQGVLGLNGLDVISVHTITANVGIFTQPGTLPVYVHMGQFGVAGDATPAGVGAASIGGVPEEVQNRLVVEADITDITAILDVYLVDSDTAGLDVSRWITPLNMTGRTSTGTDSVKGTPSGFQPVPGVPVPNAAGVIYPAPTGFGIEGGIVTQWDGAQISRARIRATKATPGILTSPTRMIRVAARTLCTPANINTTNPTLLAFGGLSLTAAPPTGLGWTGLNTTSPGTPGITPDGRTCIGRANAANGLQTGEYTAPVFEFIFPEGTGRGDPIVPNNFWTLNFLAGDATTPGPLVPQPW